MPPKKKKCRGTGKAKGYGCGKEVYNRRFGLCQSCFTKWLLNDEQGKAYLEKQIAYKKKKFEKEKRKAEREKKEQYKDYKKLLQNKINEIVRLIDVGLPCLARGYHAKQMHAGHIFSRGSNPSIRFNLHNIHRQSAQSNHYQNEDGLLREGLIKEYGQDYMNFISELRRTPSLQYSNMEYKVFYKKASKIALELRKQGKTFTKLERIKKRSEVNNEIGIYKN